MSKIECKRFTKVRDRFTLDRKRLSGISNINVDWYLQHLFYSLSNWKNAAHLSVDNAASEWEIMKFRTREYLIHVFGRS